MEALRLRAQQLALVSARAHQFLVCVAAAGPVERLHCLNTAERNLEINTGS